MAEAYRALIRANAELGEIETQMQYLGLLYNTARMLLWDEDLTPRHHTGKGTAPGVIKDIRASLWFSAARAQGFDV